MQDGHQGHVEHLDSSLVGYCCFTGLQLLTLQRFVEPSLPAIRLFFPEERGTAILPHPSRPFSDTAVSLIVTMFHNHITVKPALNRPFIKRNLS